MQQRLYVAWEALSRKSLSAPDLIYAKLKSQRKQKDRREKIFLKVMAENFTKLMKNMDPKIQEA